MKDKKDRIKELINRNRDINTELNILKDRRYQLETEGVGNTAIIQELQQMVKQKKE